MFFAGFLTKSWIFGKNSGKNIGVLLKVKNKPLKHDVFSNMTVKNTCVFEGQVAKHIMFLRYFFDF